MINKKAAMRINPRRRLCLSVGLTFMGRSSALPTILNRYKDKYLIWIML